MFYPFDSFILAAILAATVSYPSFSGDPVCQISLALYPVVSETYLVSSAEAVQINANKVNINGVLSANGNFEVDTDGNMSATSATLNNAIITSSNSKAEVSINDGNIKTTSSEGYKGVEIVEQKISLYSYNDQNNFIGALCSTTGVGTGRQFIELYADYGDSLALGYKLEEATNKINTAIEVNSDNNGLIDIYNKVNRANNSSFLS